MGFVQRVVLFLFGRQDVEGIKLKGGMLCLYSQGELKRRTSGIGPFVCTDAHCCEAVAIYGCSRQEHYIEQGNKAWTGIVFVRLCSALYVVELTLHVVTHGHSQPVCLHRRSSICRDVGCHRTGREMVVLRQRAGRVCHQKAARR